MKPEQVSPESEIPQVRKVEAWTWPDVPWRFDFENMPKDGTYCLAWIDDGKHEPRAEMVYWETSTTCSDPETDLAMPDPHWYTDAMYVADGEHGGSGDSRTPQAHIKAWSPVSEPATTSQVAEVWHGEADHELGAVVVMADEFPFQNGECVLLRREAEVSLSESTPDAVAEGKETPSAPPAYVGEEEARKAFEKWFLKTHGLRSLRSITNEQSEGWQACNNWRNSLLSQDSVRGDKP